MAVAVLIPWRPGCPHREAAWAWVQRQYATHHPTWELVEGTHTDGRWCKAAAVATALEQTTADTLVVADADVWVDNLDDATSRVRPGRWVIPHSHVHRLDRLSTEVVLSGGDLGGSLTQRPYRGRAGGGVVCVHRDDYLRAPLDPRFQGWGQEDDSWALALTRIVGKSVRLNRPLWHLWHPPQARASRVVGSQAGFDLFRRYRLARTTEAMTALLEEVTDADHTEPLRDAPAPSVL